MQITAERGKDFARSRGVGKCSRRKEGGVEGFPGGVTFSPPHTPRIPAERGDNGETLPAAARLDRDYEVITA